MSLKQFETFYWPSLRKLFLALIGAGLTPCPFFEGDYTTRLKCLAELPKGKILGLFDATDIYQAKEALGDVTCMSGMMPLSLLRVGTSDSVREYAKKLIDVVGEGGGFVMGPRSIMDEAHPELVKVWVEFTKEHGKYREESRGTRKTEKGARGRKAADGRGCNESPAPLVTSGTHFLGSASSVRTLPAACKGHDPVEQERHPSAHQRGIPTMVLFRRPPLEGPRRRAVRACSGRRRISFYFLNLILKAASPARQGAKRRSE